MYPLFAGGSPFSVAGLFQQTPTTQAQQWFQDNVNPGQKATTPVAGRVGSNLLPAAVAAAAAAASSNGGNEPNASDDLVVRVPRGLSHNLDGIPGHSMTVQGNGGIGVVTSQDAGSNDPAQKSITVTSSKGESLTMSMNQVELLLACLGGILPNAAAQQSVSYPGLSSSLPSPAVGTSLTVPIRIEKMSGDSADGYRWKKYGHKQLKGTDIHRCYYKCKAPNCPVKKQVENKIGADSVNTVIYKGVHNHAKPPPESEVGDAVKAAADAAAATQ
jgi:hypothetical protein